MPGTTILLLDEAPPARQTMRDMLEMAGCRVLEAGTGAEAVACLRATAVELMFLDLATLGVDALRWVHHLSDMNTGRNPSDVVVMVAPDALPLAAEALRRGASDYVEKPILRPEVVRMAVEKARVRQQQRRELLRLQLALDRHSGHLIRLGIPQDSALAERVGPFRQGELVGERAYA